MIGKLIGAAIGERAAREMQGGNQAVGALAGALALPLIRKLGPIGLIALAAGAYGIKYLSEKTGVRPDLAP